MTELKCQLMRQLVAVARTVVNGHPFFVCTECAASGDLRLKDLP